MAQQGGPSGQLAEATAQRQSSQGSSASELASLNELREKVGLAPLDELPSDDSSFSNPDFWQDAVIGKIEDDIKTVAKRYEMDLDYLMGWFDGQKQNMVDYIEQNVINSGFIPGPGQGTHGMPFQVGASPDEPAGMQTLIDAARLWMGNYIPGFRDALLAPGASRGGGGGGGGGARGLRAEDFDMDSLMRGVNAMSQGLLLEEASDARSIANAFVRAQIANPHKKLDFETFVRNRLLAKPRAKLIYQNKPESMTEEQFLQPYVQAAAQRIGPGFGDQLADVSIGAARLNASPQAFQSRLNRTDQVTSSAPYMSRLSEKLSSVQEVLR